MTVIAFPSRDDMKTGAGMTPAGPAADEGLRLIQAFINIRDREQRAQLIRLAERLAGQRP